MEVAFASPCDSRHEPRVKVQLGDNYQITSKIGNASIREAQTQMSPSNAAFCHCFPPPEAHGVYCQCQHPRGLPAAPRKAGGGHTTPSVPCTHPEAPVPAQFSSFNTNCLAKSKCTKPPGRAVGWQGGAAPAPTPALCLPLPALQFLYDSVCLCTIKQHSS